MERCFTVLVTAEICLVLLYSLEELFAFICKTTEESVQDCQVFVQHLYFLNTGRRPYVQDGGYVIGVGLNTPWVTRYPKNFLEATPKVQFLRIESGLVFLEVVERLAQMLHMVRGKRLFTSMSSTYASMVCPVSSLKTLLTIRWKVTPVFFSPNSITL